MIHHTLRHTHTDTATHRRTHTRTHAHTHTHTHTHRFWLFLGFDLVLLFWGELVGDLFPVVFQAIRFLAFGLQHDGISEEVTVTSCAVCKWKIYSAG